jgi:hypothetical protein
MRRKQSPKQRKAARNKRRKYQVKGARPKRGAQGMALAER